MSVNKLTIDRSKWVCKRNKPKAGPSCLMNTQGFKCCLGFLGSACGIPDKTMQGIGTLSAFNEYPEFKGILPKGLDTYTPPSNQFRTNESQAIDLNDAGPNPEETEKGLVEVFERMGIALTFEGEYLNVEE